MSSLQLTDVWKIHPDGFGAVRGVDLTIDDGEFVVIVGPSGCGKSTLLRMVAGLEEVSSGDVSIDGVRANDLTPQQRDIAMAFQQHVLYPNMTVAENIGFSLRIKGIHADRVAERVRDVAALLSLLDLLDRRPHQLSGGQQQRVGLARSIIRSPRLLLMDEPMSNLDTKLRIESRSEILTLHERLGTTTMFVTHDQAEAMALGDRVAVMREGRIVQCGPAMEIYMRPADLFVARFVGSPAMSVVRATVTCGGGSVSLAIGAQTVEFEPAALDRQPGLARMDGRDVAVGIRPEALTRDVDGQLVASVEFTESLGAEQLVHCEIAAPSVGESLRADGDRMVTLHTYLDVHDHVSIWQPLALRVDTDQLHLFDLVSGERLVTER